VSISGEQPFIAGAILAGRYRIGSLLGRGGMGQVYRAEDTKLGREIAVKLLPAGVADDEEAKRRFAQEARAASALNHPHIITIYDIGSDGSHEFIAMEYVEGESLRDVLSRERVEIKRALELTAQAASGLAAAHRAGIFHRDIKPENLMVAPTSQLKILDFGLAKLSEKQAAPIPGSNVTTVYAPFRFQDETLPGTILGTVAYMSPEQAQAREVDHRTDIFSLGAVLYEMLTGQRAFEGKSGIEILHAIITSEPRPATDVNSRLPIEVMEILSKSMAKEVGERYQHAGDFELDLRRLKRRIEANSLITERAKPASKAQVWGTSKRAVFTASILGVILLVAGMVGAWILGRASTATNQEASLAQITLTPLTLDPGYNGEPTFSPSGEIAYVTNRTGNFEIFRKLISGGAEINLTQNGADDVQPAFSPDGTQIAFVSTRSSSSELIYRNANQPLTGGDIWVMPALGGPARKIVEAGNFPSWSSDGSSIIFTRGPQGNYKLLSVSVQGGEPREIPLEFNASDLVQLNLFHPSYSSDGQWIVFETQQGDGIYVVSAGGGEPQLIARGRHPVWNANSTAIIYSSGEPGKNYSLWQVPFARQHGKKSGEATPLTVSRGRDTQPTVSRDGKLIAFAAQDVEFNIEKMSFDSEAGRLLGTTPAVITSGHSLNYFFDVSPDGAVVFQSHRGSSFQLWSRSDSVVRQLTSDASFDDINPHWSPDGKSIGFVRKRVNETQVKTSLWTMSADGVNPQLVQPEVSNFKWLPDGQSIVYHSPRDRQLYLLDVRVKSTKPLTTEQGITGVFSVSPNSQWVVYQSTLKGSVDVRAVQTSGGPSLGIVETPHEEYHPFISPSGKWLYFQRDHKNLFRVPGPAQGWRKAEPEQVTNFPESGLFLEDPQISRDGRYLFYSRASITGDIWIMKLGQ
jgi:eukaryotic-like serine/threonine-protein kinase